MKTLPAMTGLIIALFFIVLIGEVHPDHPVYSVYIVHDNYIIENHTETDTLKIDTFTNCKIIINKIN